MDTSEIIGEYLTRIEGLENDSERVALFIGDYILIMYHDQACCESVRLVDVEPGDKDLRGNLVSFECVKNAENNDGDGTRTWTFYKIQTDRGSITIRWLGESNGYYSEEVDINIYKLESTIYSYDQA